ncbi:MAG: hypothetical protein ACLURP_10075 [Ruminococcus sp.]
MIRRQNRFFVHTGEPEPCGNAQNTEKRKKYTLVNQEMNRMAKQEAGKIAAKKKAQKQYRLKQQISRFQTQIIKKAEKAAHAVAAGAVKAARGVTTDGGCGAWHDKCPGLRHCFYW